MKGGSEMKFNFDAMKVVCTATSVGCNCDADGS